MQCHWNTMALANYVPKSTTPPELCALGSIGAQGKSVVQKRCFCQVVPGTICLYFTFRWLMNHWM